MNPMEALLAELEQETANTRRMIESVPEARYDWRPHEKGRSLAELCGHIAEALTNMPDVLDGDSFNVAQVPEPASPPADRREALASFDAGVHRTREWLGGLGERAHQTWRLYRDDQELMAMPRAAAIRSFLFNHHYHHRGQLSAYLRGAGEVVPSVYGPTADIDPFAA